MVDFARNRVRSVVRRDEVQFSSVSLAGSGLRPVTRSSAMAESTFEASVFLLGSRSGSAEAACAGGAKPEESGVLLAQPARSAPARMTAPARSSIKQPLFVPVNSYGPQPLSPTRTLPAGGHMASAKAIERKRGRGRENALQSRLRQEC